MNPFHYIHNHSLKEQKKKKNPKKKNSTLTGITEHEVKWRQNADGAVQPETADLVFVSYCCWLL